MGSKEGQMNAFAEQYAALPDDDLIQLTADTASLVPEARDSLKLELERRSLSIEGIQWHAPLASSSVPRKKPILLPRALIAALGIIAILLGLRAFTIAPEFVKEKYVVLSIGFTIEAIVDIAAGILMLMNHKTALNFAKVCAILFTLDMLVGGLTPLEILEAILVWLGYFWYRSLRKRIVVS
jgi:hypothetical protein